MSAGGEEEVCCAAGKSLLGMPTSHIRALVQVLAAPPLTQLTAGVPAKAAGAGLSVWTLERMENLGEAPGSRLWSGSALYLRSEPVSFSFSLNKINEQIEKHFFLCNV